MAINLSTNTNESTIIRNATFTETVNVTVDGTPPEVISSITVTPSQTDSGVTISTTTSSIAFSGSYEDAFDQDEIKSLPNGESDITTTPTISTSFGAVPSGHFVFSAIQDERTTVTITYNVSVVYDTGTHSDTITHTIDTDTTTFQTKLTELYPPD